MKPSELSSTFVIRQFPISSIPFEYLNHFFSYQFSRKLIFSIFLYLKPSFLLSSRLIHFFLCFSSQIKNKLCFYIFFKSAIATKIRPFFSRSNRCKFCDFSTPSYSNWLSQNSRYYLYIIKIHLLYRELKTFEWGWLLNVESWSVAKDSSRVSSKTRSWWVVLARVKQLEWGRLLNVESRGQGFQSRCLTIVSSWKTPLLDWMRSVGLAAG